MSKQGKTTATPPKATEKTNEADAIAEALGQATETTTPPAPPTPPVAKGGETEVTDAEQLVAQMPDSPLKAKLLDEIKKLKSHASAGLAQEAAKTKAKAWTEFDNELKVKLGGDGKTPGMFDELAKKHGVQLVNRRIVITFPEGKPKYSNAPASGNTNGTRSGTGFKNGGKVELDLADGSPVQHFESRHAAAKALSLQYEGRRDADQVFLEPLTLGEKKELPYKFTVEKSDGTIRIRKVAK
jgi:hypothetical protein